MAVPKRKMSKARKNARRSQWKLQPMALVRCPQCRHLKRPHHVCPNCGMYKGREAIAHKD